MYFFTIKYLLSDSSSHHNCHNNIPWLWICLAHTVDMCAFFFYLKMCIQTMTLMRTKREGRVFNVFPLCWASATCGFQELSCTNNNERMYQKEEKLNSYLFNMSWAVLFDTYIEICIIICFVLLFVFYYIRDRWYFKMICVLLEGLDVCYAHFRFICLTDWSDNSGF